MGIFDDIVKPIEHVVNGLERPVKEAETLFGEVIDFTEDILREFREMIAEMRRLFDGRNVGELFIKPFEVAAMDAVSSIEKLYSLIANVSEITVDGVKEELLIPINDAYGFMRGSLNFFKEELHDAIEKMEDLEGDIKRGVVHEFRQISAVIDVLPVEIKVLSRKIKEEFEVDAGKAFAVVPEFGEFAERETKDAFGTVRRRGTAVRESFQNMEQSIRRRLENESSSVDWTIFIIIGLIVLLIAGVFLITKSMIMVKVIMLFIVIVLFTYVIYEFTRSVIL